MLLWGREFDTNGLWIFSSDSFFNVVPNKEFQFWSFSFQQRWHLQIFRGKSILFFFTHLKSAYNFQFISLFKNGFSRESASLLLLVADMLLKRPNVIRGLKHEIGTKFSHFVLHRKTVFCIEPQLMPMNFVYAQ